MKQDMIFHCKEHEAQNFQQKDGLALYLFLLYIDKLCQLHVIAIFNYVLK